MCVHVYVGKHKIMTPRQQLECQLKWLDDYIINTKAE